MRDPHEPVIPGQHKHPKEGHGGFSMPIGVSGDLQDRHDHVGPGAPAVDTVLRAGHEQPVDEAEPPYNPPEGEIALPDPVDPVVAHVQESFISGLQQRLAEVEAKIKSMLEGQKPEPPIDEQLAEELKADEPQS